MNERGIPGLILPARLEEGRLPMALHLITVGAIALFVTFGAWASFAPITELARANGRIVPSGNTTIVQHLEGGIVGKINVEEGDRVKAGDVLVTLVPTGATLSVRQLLYRQAALRAEAGRLVAIVEDRPLVELNLGPEFAQIVDVQKQAYLAVMREFRAHRAEFEAAIRKAERIVSVKLKELYFLEERRKIQADELSMSEALMKNRHTSKILYLERRRRFYEAEIDVSQLKGEIVAAREQRILAERQRETYLRRRVTNARERLAKITSELAGVSEDISYQDGRIARLFVLAPTDGIVHRMSVRNAGAVVHAGQTIAEIVPVDRRLFAEVRISPRDIGHIRIGHSVRIRVTTFDPTRFGVLQGRVTRISATSVVEDNGEVYFKAQISLEKQALSAAGISYRLSPGMLVVGEIVTGEQSLARYLMKPIVRSFNASLGER